MNDIEMYLRVKEQYKRLINNDNGDMFVRLAKADENATYMIGISNEPSVIVLYFIYWFCLFAGKDDTLEDIKECMNEIQTQPFDEEIDEEIKMYLGDATCILSSLTEDTFNPFFDYIRYVIGPVLSL